jgi:hypothetical protein
LFPRRNRQCAANGFTSCFRREPTATRR